MRAIFTMLFTIIISFPVLSQDNAKAQDIRKLLDLTGAIKIGILTMDSAIEVQKKTNSNIPEEFWNEFKKQISEDVFAKIILPIYDKYYTHQEIRELIAFYQTPIGQKTITVLPQITQESLAAGQELGKKVGLDVAEKLRAAGKL